MFKNELENIPATAEEREKAEDTLLAQAKANEVLAACSEEEMILSIFPARCREPLKKVVSIAHTNAPGSVGGMSDVGKRFAAIPTKRTLRERSMREHEAAHLNLTRGTPKSMADQAAEDGIIETMRRHSPVTSRWSKASGLRDVREACFVLMHPERVPPMLLEQATLIAYVQAFRGLCKCGGYGTVARRLCRVPAVNWQGEDWEVFAVLSDAYAIIERAKRRGKPASPALRRKVVKILAPLFQLPPPPPPPLPPPESAGSEMRITTLDLTQGGDVRIILTEIEQFERSGIRLRPDALVSAALSPQTARPFVRTEKLPGASVLIDASSSMSLDSYTLRRIVELYPASTVCYYSSSDRTGGHMVLFARDGRVTRRKELPHIGGGNDIDYSALTWLLKQDAPRYIVTDGEFCGGLAASAKRLLHRAVEEKKVTWIHRTDVADAIEHIKGGTL